jgi:hypothetical protein
MQNEHVCQRLSEHFAQADSGAPAWKAYVDYAAGIVVNGLSQCVIASTDQLLSQARSCCNHTFAPGIPQQVAAALCCW